MKVLITILALTATVLVNSAEIKDEKEKEKALQVDIGKLLKDDKALQVFIGCFTNKIECPVEASEMKGILPEAFTKDCANCEESLRTNTYKFLDSLLKTKPELYAEIEKVYDPKGDLKKKLGGAPEEGKKEAEGGKKKEEEKKNDGEKVKEEEKKHEKGH